MSFGVFDSLYCPSWNMSIMIPYSHHWPHHSNISSNRSSQLLGFQKNMINIYDNIQQKSNIYELKGVEENNIFDTCPMEISPLSLHTAQCRGVPPKLKYTPTMPGAWSLKMGRLGFKTASFRRRMRVRAKKVKSRTTGKIDQLFSHWCLSHYI